MDQQATIPTADELAAALEQMPAWQVDGDMESEPEAPTTRDLAAPAVDAPRSPLPQAMSDTPPPLHRILEAILFVGGPPLTLQRAAEIVPGLADDDFQQAVDELSRAYRTQLRPYQVQPRGQGYILSLRPRFQGLREKLSGGVREARLSQAAVDVLSLVAYRQPASRRDIDALRGADSAGVLRQLVRHGLVALQQGDDPEPLYATTPRFLQLFGLTSLEDLPQTQDLQQL